MLNRRGLITGLISLAAAPAIVRAESLMPVRGIIMPIERPSPFELWGTRDGVHQLLDHGRYVGGVLTFNMPPGVHDGVLIIASVDLT